MEIVTFYILVINLLIQAHFIKFFPNLVFLSKTKIGTAYATCIFTFTFTLPFINEVW